MVERVDEKPDAEPQVEFPEAFTLTGDPMEAQALAQEVGRLGAEVALLRSKVNYWKNAAMMYKTVIEALRPPEPPEAPAKRVTRRPAAKRPAAKQAPRKR